MHCREVFLRLAPDVHLIRGDAGFLLVSETGAIEMDGSCEHLLAAIGALRTGASVGTLVDLIGPGNTHELLNQLVKQHWIVTEYDELVFYGQFGQVLRWLSSLTTKPVTAFARLQGAFVAIIGVGGLGSQVLDHLLGAGIHRLVLLDSDKVETSNLNRQYIFSLPDVGKPKALVARDHCLSRRPDAAIQPIVRHIVSIDDLAVLDDCDLDLIVNCADEPANLDDIIASYAARRSIACITGGVGIHRGYWGPLLLATDPGCPSAAARPRPTLGNYVAPRIRCTSSHGPYNSVIAAFLANDVIAYCSGATPPRSLGKRIAVDFAVLSITTLD